MGDPGPSAYRLADRFSRVALTGLLLASFAAVASPGYFGWKVLAAAGAATAGLAWAVWRVEQRWGWAAGAAVGASLLGLLTAALVSASPVFFLNLGAFLVLLAGALAAGEIRRASRELRVAGGSGMGHFHLRLAGLVACVSASALLLTALLFFALPRTARAAFQRFFQQQRAAAGLSVEVQLGQMGRRLGRDAAAMHVRIVDEEQPLELKWRGAVLSTFDGRSWRAPTGVVERLAVNQDRVIVAGDEQRRRAGRRITYEVQLEPLGTEVLFLAGFPEVLWIGEPSVRRNEAEFYQLNGPPRERLRYGAISFLDPVETGQRPGPEWLQLPPLDPRIAELARRVTAYATSDETRAFALERHLMSHYEYSGEATPSPSKDPLAEFLFERRRGHCEYFASAMAVMLRTLEIPARVVTGFQSGSRNPLNGWYVMRSSDAHAWVEAWLPGRGWVSYDPTPPTARGRAVLKGLYAYLDAADMFWQEWVMGYDFSRQVALAARVQSSGRDLGTQWLERSRRVAGAAWSESVAWVRRAGWGLAVLGVGLALLWLSGPRALRWVRTQQKVRLARKGRGSCSDATAIYERMLSLLERRGYSKPEWFTQDEFVRVLPAGATAEQVAAFTRAYQAVRFGGRQSELAALPELLEELRRAVSHLGPVRERKSGLVR
ncbi:MAG: transglutaminaseTgpA domain-containing protein [Bryobacteraceae bacterium]|nr:transglutaminaseTgpA domain-containing protein [Bryobacteraceae bacterium]